MKKYYLIGHKLKHSMSEPIQKELFEFSGENATYEILDFPESQLAQKVEWLKSNSNGFNCTIPYKQAIIPFLDKLESTAELYGAVNTVKFENGQMVGYNTDCVGFTQALKNANVTLQGKRVLVLGNGGVSSMLIRESKQLGASEIFVCARNVKKDIGVEGINVFSFDDVGAYEYLTFDVILNGTPVGMWPNVGYLAINKELIKKAEFVYDTIYNPSMTLLLQAAKQSEVRFENGLSMLVNQAAKAQNIWNGSEFTTEEIQATIEDTDKIIRENFPVNILLTGFMGSGKSTVGKILAERMGYNFIDIDDLIVEREGISISELFARYGEKSFRECETNALDVALKSHRAVISCGGGLIVQPQNVDLIKKTPSLVVYLDVSLETVLKRVEMATTRPMLSSGAKNSESIKANAEKLFAEREDVYCENSQIVVDGNGEAGQVADQIIFKITK